LKKYIFFTEKNKKKCDKKGRGVITLPSF